MLIQRRDKSPGHCAMIVEWVTYLDRVVDHHDEAVGLCVARCEVDQDKSSLED
jgi:hypothetical protein